MSHDVTTLSGADVVEDAIKRTARDEPLAEEGPRGWISRGTVERMLSVLSPAILVALWEVAALAGRVDTRFFPAPSSIFQALGRMIQTGELWENLSISLQRIAIGFTIGAVPGVIIGLAMGLFSPIRAVIQPLVDGTFPIPKIAVLPLFIMIFGIGEESKYAIIAVAVIYLVLINTAAGVRNSEKIYLDVGKNFGASRWQFFKTIAVPGAMPQIFTGFQLALGVALIVIVATEFVGAKTGIGYLIWQSWQTFSVEAMYCGLVTTAFLGFLAQLGLDTLQRLVIPWKPELH
jgi:ABC-type nitrate/sulfonate/bicarbonate transport system permease component